MIMMGFVVNILLVIPRYVKDCRHIIRKQSKEFAFKLKFYHYLIAKYQVTSGVLNVTVKVLCKDPTRFCLPNLLFLMEMLEQIFASNEFFPAKCSSDVSPLIFVRVLYCSLYRYSR